MRINLKRAALPVAALYLLCGCRWFEVSSVKPAENKINVIPETETSITILADNSVFPDGMLLTAAEKFMEENSGVTVKIRTVNCEQSLYEDELRKSFSENSAPDMFLMFGKQGVYNWESVLEPIEESFADNIIDELPKGKSGEDIMAVPAVAEWVGIVVSNDVLKLAGVSPNSITSLQSFEDVLKKVDENSETVSKTFKDFKAAGEFPAGSDDFLKNVVLKPYLSGVSADSITHIVNLIIGYSYWKDEPQNLNVIGYDSYIENGLKKHAVAAGFIDSGIYRKLFYGDGAADKDSFTVLPYFTNSTEYF